MSSINAAVSNADSEQAVRHHPSFKWLRSERIDSLNLTLQEFQHIKTGALHYHLAAENAENVFLVAFRTVPMDSTGVAHILEHTALCGSKKYPVRDPFFMMIRRSLNTFMNAFTSSDWTAYPFASQNKKDFNNLLDVYLYFLPDSMSLIFYRKVTVSNSKSRITPVANSSIRGSCLTR